MLKVCNFVFFEAKNTKELNQENDKNPELAYTSQLQQWNKEGGGKKIVPQPVMDVMVRKTKLDEPQSPHGGVKCLLYEAWKKPQVISKKKKKLLRLRWQTIFGYFFTNFVLFYF